MLFYALSMENARHCVLKKEVGENG